MTTNKAGFGIHGTVNLYGNGLHWGTFNSQYIHRSPSEIKTFIRGWLPTRSYDFQKQMNFLLNANDFKVEGAAMTPNISDEMQTQLTATLKKFNIIL
ncbi:hypothetical protein [Aliivibrio wodanis]|uniref:hypothetical protein n=1 Tax=Aliivibrio wodanis TaxID=80852 RepID=UPI00406D3332